MSDANGTSAASRKSRRRGMVILAVLLLAILAMAIFLGWTALSAKGELETARTGSNDLQAALLDGDSDAAKASLAKVQRATSAARSDTSSLVWGVASSVPYVGRTPAAIRSTAVVLDDVAVGALPGLVDSAALLDPKALRAPGGRALDVSRIQRAAPLLTASSRSLDEATARMGGVELAGTPSVVADGVGELRTSLTDLANAVGGASRATQIAPSMLGADGPRRYLLVVQTPAESRGTGGLMGAYGVLSVKGGRIDVEKLGPRTELDPTNLTKPAVDFGADYTNLWGSDPGYWVNANLSAHFPYAAQLWQAMSARAGLGRIDGVVAADPIALAALMKVTGPAVLPDGTSIPANGLVPLVTKNVYAKIPTSDAKRDAYLQVVARASLDSVLSGRGSAGDLIKAMGAMAGERRLLVWSRFPSEQKILAAEPAGGAVPDVAGVQASPYAFVAVNNVGGTKLDTYLEREVEYSGAACPVDVQTRRDTRLTITLRNGAPATGLPDYVTVRPDLADPQSRRGSNRLLVTVYLSRGAGVVDSSVDGAALKLGGGRELGHRVVTFPIELAAQQTKSVVINLQEPPWRGQPRIDVQPLVLDQVTRSALVPC